MTPSVPVKFADLMAAYEWVSSSPDDSEAFVSRVIHLSRSTTPTLIRCGSHHHAG
jgi:hypothetical protein